MTPEQKKKLDRMVLLNRLKIIVPSIAVVVIMFGIIVWMAAMRNARVDATVERHVVAGHIVGTARLTGRRGGYQVHVRLDDGQEVDAVSALQQPPYPGEAVELNAAIHASGRVTYNIVRLMN
jgi:hypothetical protein